jgi:ribonuclease P protein component
MRRSLRLRANADFQQIRQAGRSVANPMLVLLQSPNPAGNSRFGFAVGKRIGGAVVRNKVKRRLREHMRLLWQAGELRAGADVLVIARDKASGASYATLTRALTDLLKRSGLLIRRKEEVP